MLDAPAPSCSASEQSRAIIVDSDTGGPRHPEDCGDLALVHDPLAREIAVLLVKGDHPAREALVLERAPQDPGVGDRQAVIGESDRPASHSSAISVSSSPSIPRVTLATNPTGIEASRSARFRTEPRTAAESIGGEVFAIAITAQ